MIASPEAVSVLPVPTSGVSKVCVACVVTLSPMPVAGFGNNVPVSTGATEDDVVPL